VSKKQALLCGFGYLVAFLALWFGKTWNVPVFAALGLLYIVVTTAAIIYTLKRFMDRMRYTPRGDRQKQREGEDEATLPHQTSRSRPQPKEAREE
jgi:hypothetical protein